jgi:hypothetical protein
VAVDLPAMSVAPSSSRADDSSSRLELLVSTWQPSSLDFESRARETGAFTQVFTPKLSVALIPTLATTPWGALSGRVGAGFLAMEREGKITYASATTTESQSLYLVPGQVGLQFEPALLQWQGLSFHLSASAMPAVAVLAKSALGDSRTQTGLGYELSAGGSYDLGGLSRSYRGTELTANVSQVLGRIKSSELRGIGIQAGLRVGL